jgi:ABC-type multidrug transport system fused ATPase/permease subunit
MLVGKDHAPWLVAVAKLEFKWVIRASLLFSILINIGHGWEYQVVEDMVLTLAMVYSYSFDGQAYSDYPEANQSQPYFIFSVLYFFISFGVFFIVNTVIEVKICRRMQKELREKRKRFAKMNARKSSILTTETLTKSLSDEEMKKEEEDRNKERLVIKMVAINGLLNFILRAPDLLFWLENSRVSSMAFDATVLEQYMPGVLNFIVDIGYFTYIVTFTTNFVIFYKFNKKFKAVVLFYFFNVKKI